ncbi:HNH endonuclease [Mycobacterium sp. OTB74]|uniref:HNH endonuclease n=1 Tax=Mycobacterium sp. OTB74 TaxID=1853452 RepID=UPI00247651DB|nr:HNH endonuclease [Mycobacterium sp. OTB74]MDH6245180.1 5-methylcytosine-specific restriction endonuclease McrA [Mycobacterium sp. OTB74]
MVVHQLIPATATRGEACAALHAAGLSYRTIGALLDCSYQAVYRELHPEYLARERARERTRKTENNTSKTARCVRCGALCWRSYGRTADHVCVECRRKDPHAKADYARMYRARKRGVHVEFVSSRRVFERDGWTCRYCHRPVNPALRSPHPRAATLDHTIPLCDGGPHTYANTQLTHRNCNVQKWHHWTTTQLALF